MNKLRSDATWNEFTTEQKEQIETWLFGQNLGYKEILSRCSEELGISCSWASLQRIYQRLAQERAIRQTAQTFGFSQELAAAGGDLERLRPSVFQILATRLLQKAVEDDKIREVAVYGRLLMQAETREILRETKDIRRESKDIQRDRAALSREKFQFNASKAALKALPFVDEFTKEDDEREKARVFSLYRTLFGDESISKDSWFHPDHDPAKSP
ncbi:MAG: hypothetical protein JWQ04_2745 [Pedosphaera sp.]|nr:hypothetical protein [Pedosphaera sp.]